MKTEEDRVFFFSYTCRVGQREIIKHQILETSHIDPLVEEDSSAGEGLVYRLQKTPVHKRISQGANIDNNRLKPVSSPNNYSI